MNYADTMNKAEILIKLAEAQRLGREHGRHEANQRVEDLIRNLELAIGAAQTLYEWGVRGKSYTEKELTGVEMTLEHLEGFQHANIRGGNSPTRCGGQCAGCGEGRDAVRNSEG